MMTAVGSKTVLHVALSKQTNTNSENTKVAAAAAAAAEESSSSSTTVLNQDPVSSKKSTMSVKVNAKPTAKGMVDLTMSDGVTSDDYSVSDNSMSILDVWSPGKLASNNKNKSNDKSNDNSSITPSSIVATAIAEATARSTISSSSGSKDGDETDSKNTTNTVANATANAISATTQNLLIAPTATTTTTTTTAGTGTTSRSQRRFSSHSPSSPLKLAKAPAKVSPAVAAAAMPIPNDNGAPTRKKQPVPIQPKNKQPVPTTTTKKQPVPTTAKKQPVPTTKKQPVPTMSTTTTHANGGQKETTAILPSRRQFQFGENQLQLQPRPGPMENALQARQEQIKTNNRSSSSSSSGSFGQDRKCLICGQGGVVEQKGGPILEFLPDVKDGRAVNKYIVLHVYCGKTAAILPFINQPSLEISSKIVLKRKHGSGKEVHAALARTRRASPSPLLLLPSSSSLERVLQQQDNGGEKEYYYLAREFEDHLDAILQAGKVYRNGGAKAKASSSPPIKKRVVAAAAQGAAAAKAKASLSPMQLAQAAATAADKAFLSPMQLAQGIQRVPYKKISTKSTAGASPSRSKSRMDVSEKEIEASRQQQQQNQRQVVETTSKRVGNHAESKADNEQGGARCHICGQGNANGRSPLLEFSPVGRNSLPNVSTVTQCIAVHVFCGKSASTLNMPHLEIMNQMELRSKYGMCPEIDKTFLWTRRASLQVRGHEENYFLVCEFEAQLAIIRQVDANFAAFRQRQVQAGMNHPAYRRQLVDAMNHQRAAFNFADMRQSQVQVASSALKSTNVAETNHARVDTKDEAKAKAAHAAAVRQSQVASSALKSKNVTETNHARVDKKDEAKAAHVAVEIVASSALKSTDVTETNHARVDKEKNCVDYVACWDFPRNTPSLSEAVAGSIKKGVDCKVVYERNADHVPAAGKDSRANPAKSERAKQAKSPHITSVEYDARYLQLDVTPYGSLDVLVRRSVKSGERNESKFLKKLPDSMIPLNSRSRVGSSFQARIPHLQQPWESRDKRREDYLPRYVKLPAAGSVFFQESTHSSFLLFFQL
jgi:hypothetical protein